MRDPLADFLGAATDTGFRGLAGQFNRRNKLHFNQPLAHGELMRLCLAGQASPAERKEFQGLWQERVRRLLLEFADDPAVIQVRPA